MLSKYPAQPEWNGDDLSLYEYIPWSDPNRNSVTDLVLDFKKPLPYALNIVVSTAITTVGENERRLRDELMCRYIVSAPSHVKGIPAPTSPCEQLCTALTLHYSWLKHLPGALERVYTVRKSAGTPLSERPTEATHLGSIRYHGDALPPPPPPYAIILVDDLYTLGPTSRACRTILQRDTTCTSVVGLFVGRTRRWSP